MDSSPIRLTQSENTSSDSRNLKDILRERQQGRSSRSCLPCRERKVKCDHQLPCAICRKRGHPDLCSYPSLRPRGSRPVDARVSSSARSARSQHVAPAAVSWNKTSVTAGSEHGGSSSGLEPSATGRQENSILSPANVDALGSALLDDSGMVSIAGEPSMSSRHEQVRQQAYETGILPLLGLENGQDAANLLPQSDYEVLYNSLPSDQDMVSLFETHRLRCHPFHIVTYDIDRIQSKLCNLINARKKTSISGTTRLQGDLRWICLLHAILAAGAQSSDLPLERRLSLSQNHTKQAFETLRASNFLVNPFKEALQALLLLSYVLQNDMKPQAAWVLQGSTIRLALCLGIQKQGDRSRGWPIPSDESRLLRLAIVWQDTLLSLAFDRPPASHDFDFEDDLPCLQHDTTSGSITYRQGMNWVSHLGLRYLSRHDTRTATPPANPSLVWRDIEMIEANIMPHLRSVDICTTIQEVQEYHSFRLHRNFFAATVCRQLVSPNRPSELSPDTRSFIVSRVQDALRHSAQAYMELRCLSTYARRSWAFIHNGLSCVLLLSLMPDTRCTSETKRLQDECIAGLLESEAITGSDSNATSISYLSTTLKKALKALVSLRRLADQEISASTQTRTEIPSDNPGQPLERTSIESTVERQTTRVDNNADNSQQKDAWATNEWNFPIDFEVSPLQTFDYIMSDQYGMSENMEFPFP